MNDAANDEPGTEAGRRLSRQLDTVARLLSGIGHDFNNLLTVVRGNLDLVRLGGADPEALEQRLGEIERAVERAEVLVGQLGSLARRRAVQPERLDLAELLARLEAPLRERLGPGVALEIAAEPGATIRADRFLIEQVLENLAWNARDAMPEGGRLRIAAQRVALDERHRARHPRAAPGEHVRLRVADDGPGIEPALRERVFEPFVSGSPAGAGHGLGLPLVALLIARTGGHLELESEPGRGTRLDLYLPATNGDVP